MRGLCTRAGCANGVRNGVEAQNRRKWAFDVVLELS
jgi:hypothetical protein